jgi:hypothetical protein
MIYSYDTTYCASDYHQRLLRMQVLFFKEEIGELTRKGGRIQVGE